MSDIMLTVVEVTTYFLFGAGFWLGLKIARLFDRPPLGWLLIVVAFGIASLRMLYLILVDFPAGVGTPSILANALMNLAAALIGLSGVYFLYGDFKRQLRERQADLIAPHGLPA